MDRVGPDAGGPGDRDRDSERQSAMIRHWHATGHGVYHHDDDHASAFSFVRKKIHATATGTAVTVTVTVTSGFRLKFRDRVSEFTAALQLDSQA
jgi:hypothetical protein